MEMMLTSFGRCFSNAARSGALTLVWPDTMEPYLVATPFRQKHRSANGPSV
jgi:hypothetical protein